MDGVTRRRGKGGSKKISSDSTKKKGIIGKGQGSLEWTPAGTNKWVLSRKGGNLERCHALAPETTIVAGALHARAASSTTLELGMT